jgi:hypothetical protein
MDDQMHVHWFLVLWYRHVGKTEVLEFTDQHEAFKEYILAEREHDSATRGIDPELEIVLIGAESLDALKSAYPHYFSSGTRDERAEAILRAEYHLFA